MTLNSIRFLISCLALMFLAGCVKSPSYRYESPQPNVAVHTDETGTTHYNVVLPECRAIKDAESADWQNQPMSNFGCANSHNLGMMVENPKDLVAADSSDSYRASQAVKALKKSKSGAAKQTQKSSNKKPSIEGLLKQ